MYPYEVFNYIISSAAAHIGALDYLELDNLACLVGFHSYILLIKLYDRSRFIILLLSNSCL